MSQNNRLFAWFFCVCLACVILIFRTPKPFDRFGSIAVDQPVARPNYYSTTTEKENDFALAKNQSLGFFDDVPSQDWKRMQKKLTSMAPNFVESLLQSELRNDFWWFWQSHYEPDFVCQHEQRIGRQGDGGKWICDPHRIRKQVEKGRPCLVYSIGSNNDFSFEQSVHRDIHSECEIHTFDFGDYAEGAKQADKSIHYHRQGLASADRYDEFGVGLGIRYRSLNSMIQDLGHQNRVIDIFKIDCETCEYATAASWFEAASQQNVTIRQIQVELHGQNPSSEEELERIMGEEELERIMGFFDLIYQQGYVIFHKEFNLLSIPTRNNLAIEYAFLKLDPEFVNPVPRANAVDVLIQTRPAIPELPATPDPETGSLLEHTDQQIGDTELEHKLPQ